MTDNQFTLLCLVDGELTPFPVEIDSAKTIGELKKSIKTEKSPRFDDIAADELTLWKVSIPVAPKKNRKEISLADVPSKSKEELDETDDVSDFFKETPPKKIIHIIVQRPLPVQTPLAVSVPVRAHSSIPFSDESCTGTALSGDLNVVFPIPTHNMSVHLVLAIPEIILLIANYLSRHSVATCARVCKLWHRLLIPLLYRTINYLYPRIIPIEELAKNAKHIRNLSVRLHKDANLMEDGISVFSSRATIQCRTLHALSVVVFDDADGRSCCEALILLNQQLRELSIAIVNFLEPKLSWRVVFSQCSPFLQSLTLSMCRLNEQETAQLMELGRRLKSLDISFSRCVWSEFTDEPQFPMMTSLQMFQMFPSPVQELSWFTQCPRLRILDWNTPHTGSTRLGFSNLQIPTWKHLQRLNLASCNMSDSLLTRILTTCSPLRALSIVKSGFWYRSLVALEKHSETLESLRLYDGDGLHSWMCQWIAASFPELTTLKLGHVFAHELVNDPSAEEARANQLAKNTKYDNTRLQNDLATGDDEMMDALFEARARFTASRVTQGATPWVCLNLVHLTMCFSFPFGQAMADWDKQVFQQISKFECLESLSLGQSVLSESQVIHGVNSRGLQLKVQSGLTLLAPLKKLVTLKFTNTNQNMDEEDLIWILNQWPKLESISRGFHKDKEKRERLWSLVEARGVRLLLQNFEFEDGSDNEHADAEESYNSEFDE